MAEYTAKPPGRTRKPRTWTNPNTWTPYGTPGVNDTAVIPQNVPIPISAPGQANVRQIITFPPA